MFKNKKGFTLVELLAVIVILAIILAIAVPGISGVISSSKKGAFESDAKMIVTGIGYKLLEAQSDPTKTAPVPGDITASVGDYGADPSNYSSVVIDSVTPTIQITLTSTSNSDYGAFTATATRQEVVFN